MKLKVPPVFVVAGFGFLMWLIKSITGSFISFAFPGQSELSMLLFILCMVLVMAGIYAFKKLQTTVDPTHPENATKLATVGIYKRTRNPMYLGMVFLLLGWGVKLGNPVSLILPILFMIYMTQFQIMPEEEALRNKFGKAYKTYCEEVRRWI